MEERDPQLQYISTERPKDRLTVSEVDVEREVGVEPAVRFGPEVHIETETETETSSSTPESGPNVEQLSIVAEPLSPVTQVEPATMAAKGHNVFINSPPLSAYRGQIWSETAKTPAQKEQLQAIAKVTDALSAHLVSITISVFCTAFLAGGFCFFADSWRKVREPLKNSSLPTFTPDMMPTVIHSPMLDFFKNTSNMGEVLALLPYAVLASLICLGIAAMAIYYTRAREITCDDSNLILQGSSHVMIGIKWKAIKEIEQSRTWDIFNGKRDVLKVETRGGESFRMRVTDIARKQDIGTFFNRVRTCAPQAVLKIADEIRLAEPSYTELWLKYFSAPSERNNKGLLEPGMTLDCGRYRIIETIGGGGQGTAYLASHPGLPSGQIDDSTHFIEKVVLPRNESLVVLKEYILPVHRGQAIAEKTASKLKDEAAILGGLDHPQIVQLLDGFIEDYRGYLVLEYIQGDTLKGMVERFGPQPERAVVNWALQLTEILTYLHGLTPPVVHRDITPDNIILQESGILKIVDFNVAHQVDSSATATVVGKHAYIPPEQFRGKPCAQSDIYALGGTLFYLLTATEPEPISVARPARHGAQVSAGLDAIIAKATALDLSKRYVDVSAMRADLLALE